MSNTYIKTIWFKTKTTDRNPRAMRFYEHKGKFFRDFLWLEGDKQLREAKKCKIQLYNNQADCEANFMDLVNEKDALITSVEKEV